MPYEAGIVKMRAKKSRAAFLLIVVFFSAVAFGTGAIAAEDDWRKEFEDICSKTQDAMTFTEPELKDLIERCDRLRPALENLDETQRKVYLKRLQMCRELFSFVLGSKEKN